MLLSEGSIVFHGPTAGVLPFFQGLGLQLPPRKGLAEFLQEVTSRKDQAVSVLQSGVCQRWAAG